MNTNMEGNNGFRLFFGVFLDKSSDPLTDPKRETLAFYVDTTIFIIKNGEYCDKNGRKAIKSGEGHLFQEENVMNNEKMTAQELALVLNIHEETIRKLAKTEQIPYFQQKNRMYFNFATILSHFKRLEEGVEP